MGSCDVLIALIGRDWLDARDDQGRRRLDKPHDWVRMEIQTALERRDTQVIPILVQGAEMPGPDELPDPLRKLSVRNAVELSDGRWHYDVSRLISYLEELAGPRAQALAEREAAPRPEPTRRRTRWLVLALAGAGLLIAAVAAIILLASGGGSENKEEARYVRQIDLLLSHSAATRRDLNLLIGKVRDRAISRDKALSGIDRTISERKTLAESLPVEPSSSFRHAQDLLRDALVASLRDDEAFRRWIVAVYANSGNKARLSAEANRLSDLASMKKDAFFTEYNDLRSRRLHLPPLPSY